MKNLALVILTCLVGCSLFSQQRATFRMFNENLNLINPGFSATCSETTIKTQNRIQWMGFEEAPNTQLISFVHSYPRQNVGFGANIFTDSFGVFRRSGINVNGSYAFKLTRKFKISMGLALEFSHLGINKNKVKVTDANDDIVITSAGSNSWIPDFNFGVFAKHDKFFVGLSASNIISSSANPGKRETSLNSFSTLGELKNVYHVYAITGFNIEMNDDLALIPTVYCNYVPNNPFYAQIGAKLKIKEFIEPGLFYGLNDAIIVSTKVNVNEQLNFAICYDYPIQSISNNSVGSVEILLGFTFD